MKLKILNSGSAGNCYILETEDEALIIEAGVSFKEVKKALDFNVRKIVGVVAGHVHQDHFRYAHEYEKSGIPVYKPFEYVLPWQVFGHFFINQFELVHDVPCYGFLITHPDMGKLLYASDTSYIKWRFKNLNHILVESNYRKELLCEASEDSVKRNHVLEGHMELETTCRFLEANKNTELMNVVLLHLSEHNAEPKEFKARVEKVVDCPVYVAEKGLEIELKTTPF